MCDGQKDSQEMEYFELIFIACGVGTNLDVLIQCGYPFEYPPEGPNIHTTQKPSGCSIENGVTGQNGDYVIG